MQFDRTDFTVTIFFHDQFRIYTRPVGNIFGYNIGNGCFSGTGRPEKDHIRQMAAFDHIGYRAVFAKQVLFYIEIQLNNIENLNKTIMKNKSVPSDTTIKNITYYQSIDTHL